MDEKKIEEMSKIWLAICSSGNIPRYTDFETSEERKKYLEITYGAGTTLKELLDIGIDPFQ